MLLVVLAGCAGCFIDPDRSIDIASSTQATCVTSPATCGTNLVGRWTTDQDCSLDATYACGTFDWKLDAVAPLGLVFASDGIVTISSIGHTHASVEFGKDCLPSGSCTFSSSSYWVCSDFGSKCQCTFDKTENVNFTNTYSTQDGILSWDGGEGVYRSERYCVDGNHLYLMFDDGAYMRFRRD